MGKQNMPLRIRIIETHGTQADFAEAAGVDESVVSRVVRGRRDLPPGERTRWAELLHGDPRELFDFT